MLLPKLLCLDDFLPLIVILERFKDYYLFPMNQEFVPTALSSMDIKPPFVMLWSLYAYFLVSSTSFLILRSLFFSCTFLRPQCDITELVESEPPLLMVGDNFLVFLLPKLVGHGIESAPPELEFILTLLFMVSYGVSSIFKALRTTASSFLDSSERLTESITDSSTIVSLYSPATLIAG